MDIRIISLENFDGSANFCFSVDEQIGRGIYIDRDQAIDAGRFHIADFDDVELGFDVYEAIPSDGFPRGFRPFQWKRGKKSMGLLVWGPSGMVSRGYDKVPDARSACETIAADQAAKLAAKASTREVIGPKGP